MEWDNVGKSLNKYWLRASGLTKSKVFMNCGFLTAAINRNYLLNVLPIKGIKKWN